MKYLKRSDFSSCVPWRMLGVLFLCDLVAIICALAWPASFVGFGQPQPGFYVSFGMSIVGPIVSGVLCVKGSFHHLRRSSWAARTRQMRRFSPLLWGLSGFAYAIGQMVWLGLVLTTHRQPPYPNLAHFIEFTTYFCFVLAILFLLERSITLLVRLRILLDSLIIMAAVTTLCYYFILAPALVGGHGTLLAKAVGGFYPVLDLLALFGVLMVALCSSERALRPVLIMLGLAAMLQFVVNVFHLFEVLHWRYIEFSQAGTTMVFYGLLLAGAAQTVNAILRKGETLASPIVSQEDQGDQGDQNYTGSFWKVLLPSVLVLVFGVLVFIIWLIGEQTFPEQIVIVYIGGFVVLVLMALRQFLVIYQIGVLQDRLRKKNNSLDVLNAQLEKQATTDPLTDLPNHRAVAEKLVEMLAQARATTSPCSVIFIDIDHFKSMNDCYGHLVGDLVLSYCAQVVTDTVRPGDLVGRWGGEEFVAILPDTGPEEAFAVAERMRQAVNCRVPGCALAHNLTCSLGVATYPLDATECEDLIRRADQAMYTAKRLGRNQVRTAHEPLTLTANKMLPMTEGEAESTMSEIAGSLLALVEARDVSLSQHARRVSALALRLARTLGLDPAEAHIVSLAGLLHDLGTIAMPDVLLFGHAQVDERELECQVSYAVIGAEILAPVPSLGALAEIVRAQREWLDGSGCPDGLRGAEIPLGARIIAVASAYDTLLGNYSSRSKRAAAMALKELRRVAGSRFDPRVVEALARIHATSPSLFKADVAAGNL